MVRALFAHRFVSFSLLFVGLLAVACLAPLAFAANGPIVDPVTTGSIAPVPAARPAWLGAPQIAALTEAAAEEDDANKGSTEFQATLALLDDGDAAAAFTASAAITSVVERRTAQWAAITYGHSGDVRYSDIAAFETGAPSFLPDSSYRARLENALTKADAPGADVIRLLSGQMPVTVAAQIALAKAYLADGETARATRIARAIWTENFLDTATERKVLDALGSLLTRADHWTRAVHLLMNDRATAAERLLGYLSPGEKQLALARIAVSRNAKNAKALLDAIPADWQDNPLFIFSRVQRARQAGLYESAVDWLDKAKGPLPDAAEWWYERRAIVRKLLEVGDAKLAYRAAAGYTKGPEGRLVEAHFHAGWIALAFLNDPATAVTHFEAMTTLSTLPESLTQANYWLGRARLALGKTEASNAAFNAAAAYPTLYYGQLSRAALGLNSVDLRSMPDAKGADTAFEAIDVVQGVHLLAANRHKSMAVALLRGYASHFEEGQQLLLAARLAQSLDAHSLAISIAENAEDRGIPLDLFSFPKDALPANAALAAIDKAAVYAITRQESRFQIDAVSSSGARGLMQLMPGTAKETAQKIGVDYSRSRLTSDPSYNALLGSTYLAAQLERYEGSLVLAAAAYNAGAGNANDWIATYGDPRSESVDPVVWIELIPFEETRKYVRRVVGNYLVYRARLGNGDISIADALRRIPG